MPLPDPEGCTVVGTVGRLERQKGMAYLLDAFARLPRDLQQVKLWIVGDGPWSASCSCKAAELEVEERVRFLGARPDVPALMARFDLFVLPSLWEGLPNVVIEAMAARRAVVATNVDGTPEAVAHGWTGVLAPPANPVRPGAGDRAAAARPGDAAEVRRGRPAEGGAAVRPRPHDRRRRRTCTARRWRRRASVTS